MACVAAGLLVLTGVSFLPSVAGQGPESSLPQRVAVLEALVGELIANVDDLTERVSALEDGQGSGTNSFDVLHLNLLGDLPENPEEGDICFVRYVSSGGYEGSILFYFRAGEWRFLVVDGTLPSITPPPGPSPGPPPGS